MRLGTNPNADTLLPPQPRMVAVVITHLPNRKGYHERRHEVIARCFQSLRDTCDLPLYVWDNGSDVPFRRWLREVIKPNYLTLSPNIGKASARTAILRTFPPGTIVCMSDDDILFRPEWLDESWELLTSFPNVGTVSACPVRTQSRWGIDATVKWARENAKITTGRFISEQYDYDFCKSIGRDYAQHLEDSAEDVDYLIEYKGMEAYAMSHHMQFIGYADRLGQIGLWTNHAMRAEQTFDVTVDRLGLLRLTTVDRWTEHMGNVLEAEYA